MGVQGIMPKEAGNISLGGFAFLLPCKQLTAVQQMAKERIYFFCMRYRANIIFMHDIGGQEIEEQVRPLQPQAVGGMVFLYRLL